MTVIKRFEKHSIPVIPSGEIPKILDCPSTHAWVVRLVGELERKDICDVMGNLELILGIFNAKFRAMQVGR